MNDRSDPTDAVTRLMLETFRLNGRLLAAGDRLVAPVGLTSARWQVLGAIALAGEPLPVAEIARRMGLARQSVQRTADELARGGLVAYRPNPRHKRAKLVALTDAGHDAYAAAMARHDPWAAGLAESLDPAEIERAVAVMQAIGARIDAGLDAGLDSGPEPAAGTGDGAPPAAVSARTPVAPDTS